MMRMGLLGYACWAAAGPASAISVAIVKIRNAATSIFI